MLQKWEIKKGVSWGTFWVPDHRLEDKVILSIMNDIFSYPKEDSLLISFWVPDQGMVDNVIHDVMGDVFHPNEDTSKTYLFKIPSTKFKVLNCQLNIVFK